MHFLPFLIMLCLLGCSTPHAEKDLQPTVWDIKKMGADPDGEKPATDILQAAIDSAAEQGGGTVWVSPGQYLIAPIKLKSNVRLHIAAGATLLGSTQFDDYPFVKTRWEGMVCKGFQPLLYAFQSKNVSITGRGTIDGQGKPWWEERRRLQKLDDRHIPQNKWAKKLHELNKELPRLDKSRWMWQSQFLRPTLVQFYECENVLLEGVQLQNPAFWTVHPVFSKNVTIKDIRIINPAHSPNTDGIDPESCDGVSISDCFFDVGDDCIVLKSGINEQGREIGIPCQNVTITNCRMKNGHGGVVIGSEMSGGVKNVAISNCVFQNTGRGIRLKTVRGRGGYIKNVVINNIQMENIHHDAIKINMLYHSRPETKPLNEGTPRISDLHFSNIQVDSAEHLVRCIGLPEMPIKKLSFSNIRGYAQKPNQWRFVEKPDTLGLKTYLPKP